jgi:hypothetical protein
MDEEAHIDFYPDDYDGEMSEASASITANDNEYSVLEDHSMSAVQIQKYA